MPVLHQLRSNSGFALLVVLWSVMLLAIISVAISAIGRSSARLSNSSVSLLASDLAVESAIWTVVSGMVGGNERFRADGSLYYWKIDDHEVRVAVTNEDLRVNLNFDSAETIQKFFEEAPELNGRARSLSDEIAQHRIAQNPDIWRRASAEQIKRANLITFHEIDELVAVGRVLPADLAVIGHYASVVSTLSGSVAGLTVEQRAQMLNEQNPKRISLSRVLPFDELPLAPLRVASDFREAKEKNYRQPDVVRIRAEAVSRRGVHSSQTAVLRLHNFSEAGFDVLLWKPGGRILFQQFER